MTNIRLLIHLFFIAVLSSYVELLKSPRPNRDHCDFCRVLFSRCFRKSDWCDSTVDCKDGTDELHCDNVFPNCESNYNSCYSGRCIPSTWICDGQVDCEDGSDEDCVPKEGRLKILPSARQVLNKWILRQRQDVSGWAKDTPREIVALYLMNDSAFSIGNLANELVAKELEAQLWFRLFRNQTVPLKSVELALYINAMLATCNDPKYFRGLNLVSSLHKLISKLEFIKPITLLALCNAGHPISQEHIAKLKEIIVMESKEPMWIDTKALATMALTCAMRQTRDESLNRTVFDTLNAMKLFQYQDGSFGDARTSALIMQVLIGNNDYDGWNVIKAFHNIINQFKNDSTGMLINYLIMPLLSQRSLLSLGAVNCSYKTAMNLRNLTLYESWEKQLGGKIHVPYSVKIGDEADVSYSTVVKVPVNTTFFDTMRLASEVDIRFRFQWTSHLGRKYIYSINSRDNDPELRKYWTLYKDIMGELELVDEDVDSIYLLESQYYVYWYKTFDQ